MAEGVCPVSATLLTYGDTQIEHYTIGNRQMLHTYTHTNNTPNTM